jgi:hypothetical protein
MIAARKADVVDLNDKARTILKAEGVLGDEDVTIRGRSFSIGDEVMTLRNDRGLGVINGSKGVVESIDSHGQELGVRLVDDRLVTLPTEYLETGHVAHAYAITGHKAQGMTTDRAFVLGDDSLYREWGYVAMSRGREENRLYVVMGVDSGRDDVGGAVERPYEVDQLVRSLERSRAKSLAFDANHDTDGLDTTSLKAEQQQLYERLSGGPGDRSHALTRLRDEAQRIKNSVEREQRVSADAEKKLASMGAITKTRRRMDVERLRNRINDASKVEERLSKKLREIAEEEKQLIKAQKERERWVNEQRPLVERAEVVERELAYRSRALLRERENDLPKYLECSLGQPPDRPSERAEWRESVLAIEDYRESYGIKDRNHALGGEPRNAEQRLDRERVERTIEEANNNRLGRSRESEVGLELSREL